MWRILHLEVLVGETSDPVKLEEMRLFVLGDDLERMMAAFDISVKVVLPVLCKRVKMEKLILLVYALQEIKYFTGEHHIELGENSHIRRAGGYVRHTKLNEPGYEDNKQQASLGYVFDPTQSSEVSSEAVSSSQGIVEPHGLIGSLAGNRAIAQWNTEEFSLKLCFDNCIEIGTLSKRRRHLWPQLPNLVFEYNVNDEDRILSAMALIYLIFFTSSSFIHLKLVECYFDDYIDVICWKNLRTLTITFGRFDDDLFRRIIYGSPVLETLVLCSCYGFEELDISNDSVENFVISGYSSEMDTFQINAPHIESLTIKGDFDLKAILLLNMSSVI
nr:hypothetical protein [Tanacetum cinerariifolium]